MGWIENIVGIGENGGYQHFLLFPQCFQKASRNFTVVKNRDYVVKSEICPKPGYDRCGRAIRPKKETAVHRNSYIDGSK